MKFLTNIDLNHNELQNAVLQPLAAAPSNPRLGQIYYNSTDFLLYQYNGKEWSPVGAAYELPTATASTLGGIKQGDGIVIDTEGKASLDINYYSGIRAEGETDNAVITRVLGANVPHEGDIFTIKTLIANEKYSYMAYVYENGVWNAMDGNVDATNVILPADIVTAGDYTQVGNVTKSKTATGTISAAGKSVADVFTAIFTKELNPTATAPSVTLSVPSAGAHEVGSVVSITYEATLNPGSYTYGPATGIVAESWSVTDTAGHTASTAKGSFDDVTVTDTTNYSITATANHTEGATPLTNLKNEYASAKIAAGSKSKTSGSLSGYRSFFYGSLSTAVALTSENIRKLTNSGKAVGTSQTFDLSVVEGARQVIIAFPTSASKTLSKVLDTGAFGTDIVGSFSKSTVNVEGANGYSAVSYDVWVYAPDAALGANTYTVTIA